MENLNGSRYKIKLTHSRSWFKKSELIITLVSVLSFILLAYFTPLFWSIFAALLFFLACNGLYFLYNWATRSKDPLVQQYLPLVMQQETLLMAQCEHEHFADFIKAVQKIQEEPLPFFSIVEEETLELIRPKEILPQAPVTISELERQAQALARAHQNISYDINYSRKFLVQVNYLAAKYGCIFEKLEDFALYNENIHLSAEWLLENAYTVKQSIQDVCKNLPEKFFRELPFIAEGPQKGLPALYILVSRIIADSDGRVTAENITAFLKAYQTEKIMTMGELWAFPLVMKIRLLECLVNLANKILDRVRQNQLADFWANRILYALRQDPEKLYPLLTILSKDIPSPTPYFADQLLIQLGDVDTASNTIKAWLQRKVGEDLADIFHFEQARQTLEQTSLANTISSLRRLEQISWREIFEDTSVVERILSTEASGVYSKLDFNTRDRYRHAVEKIAKSKKMCEELVAKAAVDLTEDQTKPLLKHVGYYLIDDGKPLLEKKIKYTPPLHDRILKVIRKYDQVVYLSVWALLTFGFAAVFLFVVLGFVQTTALAWVLGALSFFPFSELSIQLINFTLSHVLPPEILPKMSFKEGVPESFRTLVVIPTLLISENSIKKDLERLEIHYLANADKQVLFGLVTDFKDCSEEFNPEDAKLLKTVTDGIKILNEKYGQQFYLFHRNRLLNLREKCWMGWERKRGKLEQLNRYLSGNTDKETDNLLHQGDPALLVGTKYVLTVDSDTQLPKDSIRRLVETLAHPLNTAEIDLNTKKVLRGYTIIQPRVSTTYLSANTTWFASLFSDPFGVDPYTNSISDVYQDLFHEGVYHGKGLYDWRAFYQVLAGRLPENQILSHDLLEGAYARTGFASDIEFHDSFPPNYIQYSKRQQRWVRGDWQLLQWLGKTVKDAKGNREKNCLSLINKWKIFDNLRRSLVLIAATLILALGWFSESFIAWSSLIFGIVALPAFLHTIDCIRVVFTVKLHRIWGDLYKGILRALISFIFLPHQAWTNADAITKALYRQYISGKLLLQWGISSFYSESDRHKCYRQLTGISVLAICFGAALALTGHASLWVAAPVLLLWVIAPIICRILERESKVSQAAAIDSLSKQYLRLLARKTWRYFDDFVTAETNWLPPDNYQERIRIEVAYRTSPTNIGFYLMSLISSHKMGYFTSQELLARFRDTIGTLKKIERYEGHFLNWYDIKNLSPLLPRYVSTVDTGNMLASFWAAEEKCTSLLNAPVVDPLAFAAAFNDTSQIFQGVLRKNAIKNEPLSKLLQWEMKAINTPTQFSLNLKGLIKTLQECEGLKNDPLASAEEVYWFGKLSQLVNDTNAWLEKVFSWIHLLEDPIAQKIILMHPEAQAWKDAAIVGFPTLLQISQRNLSGIIPMLGWLQTIPTAKLDNEIAEWIKRFIEAVNHSFSFADELIANINNLRNEFEALSEDLNMAFLYDSKRKLFSIGYNVSEKRLDTSFYDLLASEARLASFIAIARGDVPIDHWWALGRPVGEGFGEIVLQSWGGTMFEYLMPVIWLKNFENTLLDYGCKVAVRCQIAYGNQLGIPWGISESAYSRLDIHNIYQYRAFGVPYLGLKRGLEEDFVITPYSSALALMIDPLASVKNLKRLQKEHVNGIYGPYEAIDYSREYKIESKHGIVIHAYMAHHMGMSLSSYCNTLYDGYLQNLFHSHPRVKATETILYERPAISEGKVLGDTKEHTFPKLSLTHAISDISHFDTPITPIPMTHLLSNGNYTVMMTNSGGGFSRYQDIDITRWRSDAIFDNWGSFIYIRDTERNDLFCNAYHPLNKLSSSYFVNFSNHKVTIKKKESGIDILTEVVVSPEDDVEIRCLTLSNLSMRHRDLELTSYVELALATHMADRAHPAFSKMFIQTEAIDSKNGLLAYRRKRSLDDPERWCVHVVATSDKAIPSCAFETNREHFIGRNRDLTNPQALEKGLTSSQGCVLDPIFSLQTKIRVDPGKHTKISFITGYANSRQGALKLIEKYQHLDASLRVMEMSWTHAELDLRRLHITHDDAKLYQRLASNMIYSDIQLRASADRLKRNRCGQERLWGHGISGDNPILLVTINDIFNLDVINSTLLAHAFWRLRGFKTDLVIVNEESTSYEQPLNEHLLRMIQNYAQYSDINKNGGIFLLAADKINREEQNLIFTVAHAVIDADRGTLFQQLAFPRPSIPIQALLKTDMQIAEEPSRPLPFLELLDFNGIGGFTTDNKEYTVYLDQKNGSTPAPWINVIANRNFGVLASETGLGMTWSGNSQLNRLTPWSNDPVENPITDVSYIRDDESGKFWTITPSPIRENDPYRCRHGHGYTVYEHNSHSIEQEMTVFTPIDEAHTPVRIQIIRLTNRSSHRRKLSLFTYLDLTLGQEKEESQRFILTTWNYETNTFMAVNHYRKIFADHVTFLSSSLGQTSYTGSRKEFIGRNQSLTSPEALKRMQLSKTTEPGRDPCFAIQNSVELYSGETIEIVTVLGEAPHSIKAKELSLYYQNLNNAKAALQRTKEWWGNFLNRISVQTPDQSLNLFFNGWLTYQNLSCRIWARSAFYQSGGAYGFRDQLQDMAALVYFDPSLTREHILLCASRQFIEGDVQHWWHPQNNSGVRTRITDDLLWLPFVTMHYVNTTGDKDIWKEEVPYLEGRALEPNEHEAFVTTTVSSQKGSLKEHCIKAIDKALNFGPHDLPLIGGGDWNDGMNHVGIEGKGESVWLGWFLIDILNNFAPWLESQGDVEKAKSYEKTAKKLLKAIETNAWDGNWYLRAFFDNGKPIGSHENSEDKIDSISQSWAVFNGIKNERTDAAMKSVEEYLIDEVNRIVLLFTPPFDKTEDTPGYIQGYPPGVRENGGQYTHAAVWVAMAFAKRGEAEKALKVLSMINPINRTKSREEMEHYRVEPYVTVADIYSVKELTGRGGWSWYTGSASLMYRAILEEILGFKLHGDSFEMDPVIPAAWDGFQMTYWHGQGCYQIKVENPQHVSRGVASVELDGKPLADKRVLLSKEPGQHVVKIVMGAEKTKN